MRPSKRDLWKDVDDLSESSTGSEDNGLRQQISYDFIEEWREQSWVDSSALEWMEDLRRRNESE